MENNTPAPPKISCLDRIRSLWKDNVSEIRGIVYLAGPMVSLDTLCFASKLPYCFNLLTVVDFIFIIT